MNFRKKPVVIEAMRFEKLPISELGSLESAHLIENWSKGKAYPASYNLSDGTCVELRVGTLEGPLRADPGDWIIRGVKGEFYPCKPDIFEQTYERVPEEDV